MPKHVTASPPLLRHPCVIFVAAGKPPYGRAMSVSPNPTPSDKAARDSRTNMLLAFGRALRNSTVASGLDKNRIVAALGTLLQKPNAAGVVHLQPLHDWLVKEQKADPVDVAGILLFIKSGEARYGVTTALPPAVTNLSEGDKAGANARFATRRPQAEASGPNKIDDPSGSHKMNDPSGSHSTDAAGKTAAEASGPNRVRETTGSHKKAELSPAPPQNEMNVHPRRAGGVFLALLVITVIVALPLGLGAHEAGWKITPMWAVRQGLLLAAGLAAIGLLSQNGIGKALRHMLSGGGALSALALVGGAGIGLVAQLVSSTSDPGPDFVLPVVLGAGLVHAVAERLCFFALQKGLGGADSPVAFGGVIVMQLAYVFSYASVHGPGATLAMWLAYVLITTAGPTALLSRGRSVWPALAWHVGFTLANIGVAAS